MAETAYQKVTMEGNTSYEEDIRRAAGALIDRGKGDWLYLTHYMSGTTVWRSPDKKRSIMVDKGGEMK